MKGAEFSSELDYSKYIDFLFHYAFNQLSSYSIWIRMTRTLIQSCRTEIALISSQIRPLNLKTSLNDKLTNSVAN